MLALAPILQDPGPESRCGNYFRANDVDLSNYESVANARDAIGLLQALDYPAYNIYGISYGTRLATVVMRLYEEASDDAALPTIRSAVIDGVMPTTLNQAGENPVSEQLVALRVFADCEGDATALARWRWSRTNMASSSARLSMSCGAIHPQRWSTWIGLTVGVLSTACSTEPPIVSTRPSVPPCTSIRKGMPCSPSS